MIRDTANPYVELYHVFAPSIWVSLLTLIMISHKFCILEAVVLRVSTSVWNTSPRGWKILKWADVSNIMWLNAEMYTILLLIVFTLRFSIPFFALLRFGCVRKNDSQCVTVILQLLWCVPAKNRICGCYNFGLTQIICQIAQTMLFIQRTDRSPPSVACVMSQ